MKKLLLLELVYCLFAFIAPPKWTSLFDGKTIKGWHSWHKDGVVGWYVEDGALTPDGTGGDLVTDKEYENFELEFEFKIPKGSNSGVVYKVIDSPENKSTYTSGPEYQVIDDKGYLDGDGKPYKLKDTQMTGANYDMIPPSDFTVVKAPGEWNKGRILVKNNHVEHYLNGKKVVEYEYGSENWKALVAKSKFANWSYATPHAKGKIALQNHNPKERVWYKNIQIREL
ncbi:3-keto-disaccharide hydrolase [Spirosoma litoris]